MLVRVPKMDLYEHSKEKYRIGTPSYPNAKAGLNRVYGAVN